MPPSPAKKVMASPTNAPANGAARRQPRLGAHATATNNRNAAPSGLNKDATTAAAAPSHACRARIASTATSPAVVAHAKGARPTIRSPTTNTANHNRATTAGQLSARPMSRPKSAVDIVQASAVAGTVPKAQPTAGNKTL